MREFPCFIPLCVVLVCLLFVGGVLCRIMEYCSISTCVEGSEDI